jgi:hypothetical protein
MPVEPATSRRLPLLRTAALSVVVALACAIWSVSSISLLPPKIAPRQLQTASATTHVMIDLPRSQMTDPRAAWDYFGATAMRADLVAHVMASTPALDHIARYAGVRVDEIAAVAPVTAGVQSVLTEPGSEQRAREILLSGRRYRLEIQSRPGLPLIDIYAQAPTTEVAERLAGAASKGMADYLRVEADQRNLDPKDQVQLEQLGPPRSGVLNPGVGIKLGALTFLAAFGLSWSLMLLLAWLLPRREREPARPPRALGGLAPLRRLGLARATASGAHTLRWPPASGSPVLALPVRGPRVRVAARALVSHGGDWPRTTRVLPWMIAMFIAVLWLVPFDSIQLTVSLPVDLKFDRLVLPFVALTWLLALIAGGHGAPRLRLTWIHVAVGAFVALAWLSVILDAGSLNQTLELDSSLKKLPLLLSYLSIFIIIASSVRRSEVNAFLKFTLVLAVICSLGMVWEYRSVYNIFFDWSDKLLPGIFRVADTATGWDLGGRRVTHGPAAHGLVAATMLAMALPIAIVGLMQAKRWRDRILYGAGIAVIMTAVMATQRKTGILAPLSAVLTLAYFRRRELLRMLPVAIAGVVAVIIISPGTVAPVLDQFKPDRLGADTVSDRASDYDAIRPDVWTHLALGRGYGSYQPVGHRILDSEVLVRTVEMGVLGLIAFLMLGLTVVVAARQTIGSRHPVLAPPALAGAAAAMVFVVVAALFDTMSFPQDPYIFLCFAALVAVVLKPPDE